MNTIRIVAGGVFGHQTRVIFTDSEGEETDISNVCKAVSFDIRVGEINRATVELVKVEGEVEAELVDLVVERVKPRWWRHRLRDVTALGHLVDKWART